jgi:hypothetical protein
MQKWTWALVTVVGVLLLAIWIMFIRATEPELQVRLLGWLDQIIPFVVGAAAGGAAGAGLTLLADDRGKQRRLAVDWTWPLAVAVSLVILAIGLMVGDALNGEIRDKLLSYFTSVIPFVVGTGAGAATGRAVALGRI